MPAVSSSLLKNEAAATLSALVDGAVVPSSTSWIQLAVSFIRISILMQLQNNQHHLPANPFTLRFVLNSAGVCSKLTRASVLGGSVLPPRLTSASGSLPANSKVQRS